MSACLLYFFTSMKDFKKQEKTFAIRHFGKRIKSWTYLQGGLIGIVIFPTFYKKTTKTCCLFEIFI